MSELAALLKTWRRTHEPRVADAIDRVSDELASARGAIEGKTQTAQLAAVLALHQKQQPEDLGRILKQLWPGTWQKAVPLLKALADWPEDPRIAKFLATTFAEPPWASLASYGFFRVVHERLRPVNDVRVVPLLEAGDAHRQPHWYRSQFQAGLRAVIERLKKSKPKSLNAAELRTLEACEARYREVKQREGHKTKGERELLEQVLAKPQDLQARAVFADWLTEHADPRGECITLQLLAERTRAQAARLNALLKKHGADWAGSLDAWFEREGRLFEGGFLVGGRLRSRHPRPFAEAVVAEPLWKLVHTVELDGRQWVPPELVPQLRALHNVEVDDFVPLANAKTPLALEELTLGHVFREDLLSEVTTAPGLPKLRTLGFKASLRVLPWLKKAKLLEHVTTLRLRHDDGAEKCVDFVRRERPRVTAIELSSGRQWLPLQFGAVTLRRVGAGPFTEVTGDTNSPGVVRTLVKVTEPKEVKTLTLRAHRALVLTAEEKLSTEAALAQFTNAHLEVPWKRERAVAPKKKTRRGARLVLDLEGSFLRPDMGPLWRALGAGGFEFDSYRVGQGSTHRLLGAKPVEVLSKWGANERCQWLDLYRDGGGDALGLGRARQDWAPRARLEFDWAEREPQAFLDWLETLLPLGDVQRGSLNPSETYAEELFGFGSGGGRLVVYGTDWQRLLPAKRVAVAVKKLGGFVRASPGFLMFGASPQLERDDSAALRGALWPIVVDEFTKRHGVDFEKFVRAAFAKPVRALGFTEVVPTADPGSFLVEWHAGVASLRVVLSRPWATQPWLQAFVQTRASEKNWSLSLAREAFDAKAFADVLERAVERFTSEAPTWLADPEKSARRR